MSLLTVVIGGLLFWFGAMYIAFTKPVPASGGSYTEGVLGQPTYVNPLFNQAGEADGDLSRLIYDGLFAYDAKGSLQPRLAEAYEVTDEGRRYVIKLKQGVKWHDGQDLKADDVVFTYKIIQDPAYRSNLRLNWQGVDIERIDDMSLSLTLRKPYFGFLENLTVGILPKHIWENVAPEKFNLVDYNLSPIGSGPYQFSDFKKDSNGNILWYEMHAFPQYSGHTPYISKLTWRFYPDEESLIDAYNRREVMGMSNLSTEKESLLQDRKSTHIYELKQPRSFAVFFNNTKNVALAQKEVRKALSRAVDRESIVNEVLSSKAEPLVSPFTPHMAGYSDLSEKLGFNPEEANKILDENGWVLKDGVREKNGNRLEFTLTAPDYPNLIKTAEALQREWALVGARIEIQTLGVADFQQNVLRPREYEALLYGEAATSFVPDPYSFWHSSQKRDPGLNLALMDNKDVDALLTDARETLSDEERNEKYKEFQSIFAEEAPAVFLYASSYLYVVNDEVQGITVQNIGSPSDRLNDISNWYVKTKRVGKDS